MAAAFATICAGVSSMIPFGATAIVRAGYAAIADAVYARPADREAIERAAQAAHVPFFGIWLEAPAEQLTARITQRIGDASDADADVENRPVGGLGVHLVRAMAQHVEYQRAGDRNRISLVVATLS